MSLDDMVDATDRLLGRAVRERYWVTTAEEVAEEMDAMDAHEMREYSHDGAAQAFMDSRASDLDYPDEIDLWVWQSSDKRARKITATADRVTVYRICAGKEAGR